MSMAAETPPAASSPEDAVVVSEVLRLVRNAVGACLVRADGNLNQRDFYDALDAEFAEAQRKAYPEETP